MFRQCDSCSFHAHSLPCMVGALDPEHSCALPTLWPQKSSKALQCSSHHLIISAQTLNSEISNLDRTGSQRQAKRPKSLTSILSAMKLGHSELPCHQKGLMDQLREFWKEGHLCDVVLKSIDGTQHPVHRNVLSAASAALKALLCAPFREAEQIRQGKPIEMAASSGVVGAFVDYIYGGEPDVASMDAVELLRLAGAYGLPNLAEAVQSDLQATLDSQLALQLLQEAVIWGLPDLRLACEEQIAKDFHQCTLREDFLKLTAKQLQRILQREDLKVSREEVAVEAVFKWAKTSKDKQKEMVLLLSNIDFPSLSNSNLKVLCHAAQSLGPSSADWECEVKHALSVHKKRATTEVSTHRPKRQCLSNWVAGLGAFHAGKKVTPTIKRCLAFVSHQGAFFFSREEPTQILSCNPGEENLRVVAGDGAAINGFNELENILGLAVLPTGEMIVGHFSEEKETAELLSFQNGFGKVLLDIPGFEDICCSPNGVIYVLDAGGTRVQRLEGSRLTPLVNSEELPEGHAFSAHGIFVSKQEVVYINCGTRGILRFCQGTSLPTVVLDFRNDMPFYFSNLCVTEDERIFLCEPRQHRILLSDAGERPCSELDVSGLGKPWDLSVEDGKLNVFISAEGEGWVQQFALPPKLQPWWSSCALILASSASGKKCPRTVWTVCVCRFLYQKLCV